MTNLSKSIILSALLFLPTLSNAITLPDRTTTVAQRDVQLSWSIPTQRQNGDAFLASELGGYQLAVGCGDTDELYDVPAGVDTYTVPDLPIGSCDFAISAIDTDGLQSPWSDVVTAQIKDGYGPQKIQLFNTTIKVVINISQ